MRGPHCNTHHSGHELRHSDGDFLEQPGPARSGGIRIRQIRQRRGWAICRASTGRRDVNDTAAIRVVGSARTAASIMLLHGVEIRAGQLERVPVLGPHAEVVVLAASWKLRREQHKINKRANRMNGSTTIHNNPVEYIQ